MGPPPRAPLISVLLSPWTTMFFTIALHYSLIYNGAVWDDRAAVIANADTLYDTYDSTFGGLLVNDFWGQPIRAPDSHKSWRPLTTLSYRVNDFWRRSATISV